MSIQIRVEELTEKSAVIVFDGALTLGMSLNLVDSQIRGLIDKGVDRLVLELANVSYCDSTGLGVIVQNFGLANQRGGTVRLCSLSERMARVLKMTTTDSFLPVDADRAASLAALG